MSCYFVINLLMKIGPINRSNHCSVMNENCWLIFQSGLWLGSKARNTKANAAR